MLRSDLCDYYDAYIVVKGNIFVNKKSFTANGIEEPIIQQLMLLLLILQMIIRLVKKKLAFKNNAPFINCVSKNNGVKIDNAEDLDVVISVYNLLEHSKNYRKTTGSLWNYYRNEPSNPLPSNSESFKQKTNIIRKTSEDNIH